eukprot:scaffold65577_cov66-Phaeocystis_antarctica.AAC.1
MGRVLPCSFKWGVASSTVPGARAKSASSRGGLAQETQSLYLPATAGETDTAMPATMPPAAGPAVVALAQPAWPARRKTAVQPSLRPAGGGKLMTPPLLARLTLVGMPEAIIRGETETAMGAGVGVGVAVSPSAHGVGRGLGYSPACSAFFCASAACSCATKVAFCAVAAALSAAASFSSASAARSSAGTSSLLPSMSLRASMYWSRSASVRLPPSLSRMPSMGSGGGEGGSGG